MTVGNKISVKSDNSVSGNKWKQWIVGFIANTVFFTYGTQTGWMSPSIHVLQGPESPSGYALSENEISLIASSICITAIFSSMCYSLIADRFGRKIALICIAVPQAIGWILKIISAHPIVLIASQGFCGIASGGVFSVTPIYIKEISEDSIRGAVGSVSQILQSFGIFVMYAMGAYMDYDTILLVLVWVPIVNLILIFKVPETPPFLVKCGRVEEAVNVLAYLTGLDNNSKKVVTAISKLNFEQEQSDNLPKVSIRGLFADKATRRAFFIGFLMISILDLGGTFAVFPYASIILRRSGVTVMPDVQALAIPAVLIVGCLVSSLTIEKFGRKPLLTISLFFNATPMGVLATVLVFQLYEYVVPPWIPVISLLVCIFAFGSGVLPVPYIVMSEIFSFQIRAKILGVYITYGWFLCFLQTIAFPPLSQALGMYTMFYIFFVFNMIGLLLCIFFMPETKGKNLEQIEKELKGK